MKEELVCMADIQNKIYEAGLFRPEEKVVLATKGCVLLEYFTGKTYSYRMVNLSTLKAKRLFSRQKPLTQEGYQRAIEKCWQRRQSRKPRQKMMGGKGQRNCWPIFSMKSCQSTVWCGGITSYPFP